MRRASTFLLLLAGGVWGCSETGSSSQNWAHSGSDAGKGDGSTQDGGGGSGGFSDGGGGGGGGGKAGGGTGGTGGQLSQCVPGSVKDCYTGPSGSEGVGPCKAGKTTCNADGFTWGACAGQVLPATDDCTDAIDNDCNGVLNDGNHLAPGCACTPGATKCLNNKEYTCNAVGDGGPSGGPCCKAGEFNCVCNEVLECDLSGPSPKWIPKTPALVCTNDQRCDRATGTCQTLTVTGTNVVTGTYMRFAYFTAADGLQITGNVDDVTSYGDRVYINRGPWYSPGVAMDEYKITLLDSDGDGKLEPNQHPDNPNEPGPMEQRTLTFVRTYTAGPPDNAPMGICHRGEMYATADRIFTLGPGNNGDITEYILATGASNVVAHPTTPLALSQMGYGAADGLWYASFEVPRRVYSFCPAANRWIPEFEYPDLAGDHLDGMEVIVSFSTGVQYVYVSDMTSDFIAQYRRNSTGGWVQQNVFKYVATSDYVEGLGFGALKHFWVTSGSSLYELGGGDLTGYLQ